LGTLTSILAEIDWDKNREDEGKIEVSSARQQERCHSVIRNNRFGQTAETLFVEYYNIVINTL